MIIKVGNSYIKTESIDSISTRSVHNGECGNSHMEILVTVNGSDHILNCADKSQADIYITQILECMGINEEDIEIIGSETIH